MINVNNCANMPHDTNTLSAGLGHAAQAHTNSQPPLNCSNNADTVTMNWMQQSSDLVQQNTARRELIFKSFFLGICAEIALLLGITSMSLLLTMSCERHGHRYR